MIEFTNCKCKIEKGAFNINDIQLDCSTVWKLISSGNTVGVFQLEKKLGQDWARKVKPDSINGLAALISLIRPGPLNAGMSQDYVDIKFGRKKHSYLHSSLEPILKHTYGCLAYQEQALRIAMDIAGFNPEIADTLREAIGKKKPKLMAKLKDKFVTGCQEHSDINIDIAEEIFSWIEKCQRYCVSGDTIIRRPNSGRFLKSCEYSVEHMYHIRHNIKYAKQHGHTLLRRKWMRLGHYGKGLSLCDDERIRPNIIIDIQSAGIMNIYKITLENGATIKVTANHKFPTPKGKKTLGQLVVGDNLYSCGVYEQLDFKSINRFSNKSKCEPRRYGHQCIENGYPVEIIKIKSIELSSAEEAWNVTMDAPNHNFVISNNIITSNSFNKSHAVSYAMISYATAWLKCHFPQEFFTSYLTYSQYKGDPKEEIYKLVQDARFFNVKILPPDIRRGNTHFQMVKEESKGIAFGLSHIRGVGTSAIEKIVSVASETKETYSFVSWGDFLASVPDFHRNVGIALIKSGACDCYGMSRNNMIRELETVLGRTTTDCSGKKIEIKGLTKKERTYFFNELRKEASTTREILHRMCKQSENKTKTISQMTKSELVDTASTFLSLSDDISKKTKKQISELMLQNGYKDNVIKSPCSNDARREIVKGKAEELEQSLEDTSTAMAIAEKHFLGIALSCSQADDADSDLATHTCLDIAHAKNKEQVTVCAIIDSVKNTKTKRGKNPGQPMCFLTISDSTYSIDYAVVFPDVFMKTKALCHEDFICLIYGYKKDGSLIVQDIQKLI